MVENYILSKCDCQSSPVLQMTKAYFEQIGANEESANMRTSRFSKRHSVPVKVCGIQFERISESRREGMNQRNDSHIRKCRLDCGPIET
jgi:hypothetical protein